tara:strand:- start:236 stop:397 length:162 start_codon:yes stop_codon:yes gene_type:complete
LDELIGHKTIWAGDPRTQLVAELNKEIYWTGWYECGNTTISWTPAPEEEKKAK